MQTVFCRESVKHGVYFEKIKAAHQEHRHAVVVAQAPFEHDLPLRRTAKFDAAWNRFQAVGDEVSGDGFAGVVGKGKILTDGQLGRFAFHGKDGEDVGEVGTHHKSGGIKGVPGGVRDAGEIMTGDEPACFANGLQGHQAVAGWHRGAPAVSGKVFGRQSFLVGQIAGAFFPFVNAAVGGHSFVERLKERGFVQLDAVVPIELATALVGLGAVQKVTRYGEVESLKGAAV